MYLTALSLENYRNYESLALNLTQETNIFYGDNGQGKTNILEAVFYCAIGKSFRGCPDEDLVRRGQSGFCVKADYSGDITESINIKYTGKSEKSIKVNGIYLRKLGHLMGNMLAVVFSPEDLHLINEGPSVRRKMLDIAISQVKPSHYFDLSKYNTILREKNNLLRDAKFSGSDNFSSLLDVYNEQLSEAGAGIILRRKNFTDILSKVAEKKNDEISGGEKLSTEYYTDSVPCENVDFSDANAAGLIKKLFYQELSRKKEKEIERMATLSGPHHDDLIIRLNGEEIKKFGSQGQKRTAVLSLKLSELSILKGSTGRNPVLLLDDVFSELDASRQRQLLDGLKNFQTFITCTDINELPKELLSNSSCFSVKKGTCT